MDGSRRSDLAGTGFRLKAVLACIPADQALADPRLSRLIVDDACWALARADWEAHRPPRWRRLRVQEWQRDGLLLTRDRLEIAIAARERGLSR